MKDNVKEEEVSEEHEEDIKLLTLENAKRHPKKLHYFLLQNMDQVSVRNCEEEMSRIAKTVSKTTECSS